MDPTVSRKILVVDDEPDVEHLVRQKFRRRIRQGELDFSFAYNGVEALERLRQDPELVLVLTDINMPEMDGLTLLGQLDQINPMIKAVVVSAYGDMKNIRTAMNRGAFDFVTKPIDLDDLEITLDRTLEHLSMLRDALAARDKLVAMRQELDVAAQIQQSLLPTEFPCTDTLETCATMHPAKDVAGDFYDCIALEQGKIAVAIGDVSGKGMPAALFMAVSRTLLRAAASAGTAPGACLAHVNNLLCEDNDAAMFVTLFYGVLDTATGEFVYANGGHCPPYIIRNEQDGHRVAPTGGMALGVKKDVTYHDAATTLSAGDSLFLYTDGVTEAFDRDGNQFGEQRLTELLVGGAGLGPKRLLDKAIEEVRRFAGGEDPSDDIACMVLRCTGNA